MSILNVWYRVTSLGLTADLTISDAKHVRFTNIAAILAAAMMPPWVPVNMLASETSNTLASLVVGTGLLI